MTKKYVGKDGGRYIYNQDLEAIQDVGLKIVEALFSSFGNMIVSGVDIGDDKKSISNGYVYINGYLREFKGRPITKLPVYLYEQNREETVQYKDEQSKVGRIVYGVELSEKEPVDAIDPITGKKVSYITITENDDINPTLKNTFFGKYSLLKNTSNSQTISGDISFARIVKMNSDVFFDKAAKIGISSITGYGDNISFSIKEEEVFNIAFDGTIYLPKSNIKINKDGIQTHKMTSSKVVIDKNGLSTVDGSELMINQSPLNKESSFSIFDGVNRLIQYIANSNIVKFFKGISVNKSIEISNSELGKDMDGYTSSISFVDKSKNESFSIKTTESGTVIESKGVTVKAASGINLESSKVMENGMLLSEKYASKKAYESDKKTYVTKVEGKGLSESDYTEEEKEKLGAIKTSTIEDDDEFGYVTSKDVNAHLSKKVSTDAKLSDLVVPEEKDKRDACKAIGAAFNDDVELKKKDTGWVKLSHPTSGELHNLFARQIGNQVWIQGKINTSSSVGGVFAKLPNTISPPAYDVYASYHEIANKDRNRGLSIILKKSTINIAVEEQASYTGMNITVNLNYLIN